MGGSARLATLDVDGKLMGLTDDGAKLPQESVKEGLRRAKYWVMDHAGTEPYLLTPVALPKPLRAELGERMWATLTGDEDSALNPRVAAPVRRLRALAAALEAEEATTTAAYDASDGGSGHGLAVLGRLAVEHWPRWGTTAVAQGHSRHRLLRRHASGQTAFEVLAGWSSRFGGRWVHLAGDGTMQMIYEGLGGRGGSLGYGRCPSNASAPCGLAWSAVPPPPPVCDCAGTEQRRITLDHSICPESPAWSEQHDGGFLRACQFGIFGGTVAESWLPLSAGGGRLSWRYKDVIFGWSDAQTVARWRLERSYPDVLVLNSGIHAQEYQRKGRGVSLLSLAHYAKQTALLLQMLAQLEEEADARGRPLCVVWKTSNLNQLYPDGPRLEALNNLSAAAFLEAGYGVVDPGPVTKANVKAKDLHHHENILALDIVRPFIGALQELCPAAAGAGAVADVAAPTGRHSTASKAPTTPHPKGKAAGGGQRHAGGGSGLRLSKSIDSPLAKD